MPFDPQVQALHDQLEREQVPRLYTLSIEAARAADVRDAVAAAGTAEPVAEVRDLVIPGPAGDLPGRLYRPAPGEAAGQEPAGAWPVLVYFFGGGWSLGTLDTCDGICRVLANLARCVTISVGYRLAPEHKFPAAVHDCHAAAAWAASHAGQLGLDASRLAVAGDSSGGNLAAAVSLLARDRGGPALAHQLLVYPNTDYQSATLSMRQGDDPQFFNSRAVDWYWDMYLADPADGASPLASPLRAADLSGLPPATVITAEYDPLRDEGEQYAARLQAAGVPAELIRYDGVMHGFFTMVGELAAARRATAAAAARLRAAFAESPPAPAAHDHEDFSVHSPGRSP